MRPGMVTNLMAGGIDFFDQIRVLFGSLTNQKEGGVNVVLVEYGQNVVSKAWYWPIVEG